MGLFGGSFSTYSYALGNPIMFRDPLGLDVTMTCRPVAAAGYLGLSAPVHCGVFVYHPVKSCDGTTTNSIDSQFSVPGGGQSPTTDPNNQTYLDDRNAFFNPGGNNTNVSASPAPSSNNTPKNLK